MVALLLVALAPCALAEATPDSLPLVERLSLQLPAGFFAKTFERKWALLRGPPGARDVFQKIWSWRHVVRLADREGFRAYEFGIPRPRFDPEPGDDGAAKAHEALQRNLTLVQNHVHRSFAPLSRYMRRASDFFGLPGGMNSYATPAGSVGFAYHFDPSDAFILQVQGSKTWELCSRRLPDPFGFSNPTYNQVEPGHPDVTDCTVVELHEGDALYLPIGLIHRAATSQGMSIHLTMSLNRQFCSTVAMMLNVAEQINPSRETGFAQKPFLDWVNRVAADPAGALAELHDVPKGLRCYATQDGKRKRCPSSQGFFDPAVLGDLDPEQPLERQPEAPEPPEDLVRRMMEGIQRTIELLRSHPSASSERLKLAVRVEKRPEPTVGHLFPEQVLSGLAPLVKAEPCRRALLAWRGFFGKQRSEYDEVILERLGEDVSGDGAEDEDEDEDEEDAAPQRAASASIGAAAGGILVAPSPPAPPRVPLRAADRPPPPPHRVGLPDADDEDREESYCSFRDGEAERAGVEPPPFRWAYPEEGFRWSDAPADAGSGGVAAPREAPRRAHAEDDALLSYVPAYIEPPGIDDDFREAPGAAAAQLDGEEGLAHAECCDLRSAEEQVLCANETAPPSDGAVDESRVLIVSYATPHVFGYARYALAVNANWAKRFDHSFVVDGRDLATGGFDVKNAKVMVKLDWASRAGISEPWMLWIGADAVFVDFDESRDDVLRRLIRQHGADANIQVIITRDPHGRAGNSLSLFNADVILLRRSSWTSGFLQRWWDDPRMKEGRTDQEVLELLYIEDVMGANSKFVLLPPLTLNSDSLSIVGGTPRQQPVVHLGGHADTIRTAVFRKTLGLLCDRPLGPDAESLELQDIYLDALRDEVRDPGEGMSSGHVHSSALSGTFHRLAWHLEERGRLAEAIEVQRDALRIVKQRLGPRSRETTQAASALAGSLRAAGRLEEAENLHRWAYQRMSENLGPGNRDTLTGANNLGLVLEARGRVDEAERLFRDAYDGFARTVGPEAPGTVSAAFNLASSLSARVLRTGGVGDAAQQLVAEAEKLHRQALHGRELHHGADSPLTLESIDALASLIVATGGAARAKEAEMLQRRSLRARAQPGSAEGDAAADRGAVQARSTLAQALRLQGRLPEAVDLFRSAYDLCRGSAGLGGPDGANTFAAASNLAMALQDTGRIEEAGELFRVAVAGLRRALGEDHPNTRSVRVNYEKFLQAHASG